MTVTLATVGATIAFFAARIRNAYDYGNMFSPSQLRDGTDCSGSADTLLRILTTGNGGPVDGNGRYIRTVSTESWPYNYGADLAVAVGTMGPYGTICAGDAQPGPAPTVYPPRIPADAAAIVYLLHGGGGLNSHMMIAVNNGAGNYIVMETGGDHDDTGGNGQYASPNGPATSTTDAEWTDIWYVPGPVQGGATPPPPPPPPPLTPAQQCALAIIIAGQQLHLSPDQIIACLATGIQESNLDENAVDGEDEGVYQQDPGYADRGTMQGNVNGFFSRLAAKLASPGASPNIWLNIFWLQQRPSDPSADAAYANGRQAYLTEIQSRIPAATAYYNQLAPTSGGFLMALTDQQQQDVWNALCGPVASSSAFAKPGEGAIWTMARMVQNDDGFIHPMYTAFAAYFGQPWAMAVLATTAAIDLTANPGEAENVALAQAILGFLGTGGPPAAPTPQPPPTPPLPDVTPDPAPAPAPPGTININTTQLLQWGKDALTILGTIGTWATAVHDLLGQYLPGASGTVVPAAFAAATTGLAAHAVRGKRVAQKQLVTLKGTP